MLWYEMSNGSKTLWSSSYISSNYMDLPGCLSSVFDIMFFRIDYTLAVCNDKLRPFAGRKKQARNWYGIHVDSVGDRFLTFRLQVPPVAREDSWGASVPWEWMAWPLTWRKGQKSRQGWSPAARAIAPALGCTAATGASVWRSTTATHATALPRRTTGPSAPKVGDLKQAQQVSSCYHSPQKSHLSFHIVVDVLQ